MTFVSDLDPQALWRHFDHILTIPRGSGNEAGMRAYVQSVAERSGCAIRVDTVGNVVVSKAASAGRAGQPTTLLQSHLDMVNEKNSGTVHDFDRDPIRPVRDGAFLRADGTTLGSDNGIGVAAMLAVMEDSTLAHGPLELLFTVDEERGLTGASGLDADLLSGTRLINLDSEEEGILTVGCAGGANSELELVVTQAPVPAGSVALRVTLAGLKGGHSGVDIHLQRGNALKLLARAIQAAIQTERVAPRLAELAGGDKTNAIPREASAVVIVPQAGSAAFSAAVEAELAAIGDEYRPAEPGFAGTVTPLESPASAWDEATSTRVLRLATALPHGVLAMSYDIPGLVETSTNLARIRVEADGNLHLILSNRSSVASALTYTRRRIRSIGELAGATVTELDGYPGWKPDLHSPLLEVLKQVHTDVLGFEPKVGAIHAGLECGIIGEKRPGMDMISIGPTIQFPHSPDERVEVETVGRFWALLKRTLEVLG